jgi:hypothetical protein
LFFGGGRIIKESKMKQVCRATLAGMAFLAACHSGPPPMSLEVPLNYNATEMLARDVPMTDAYPNLKLFIEVKDARTDTSKIGQNLEEEAKLGARPITGTGPTPADFVASALNRNFPTVGVPTVTDRGQANRILTFSVTQFFVTETGSYKANIGGTATVSDASGKQLWSGPVAADNSTWGKSMSVENYTQVLTNASIEVAENLMKTPAFTQALKVQ